MDEGTKTSREARGRGDDPTRGLGPTRARVLALLQDVGEPMTAVEAGDRLGLHANSARFHLDRLVEEGLVRRQREERITPGRPKVLYAAASAAPAVAHRSYRLLAEILTSLLTEQLPDPAASAEQAGRAWGRHLSAPARSPEGADAADALGTLVERLDGVGFDSHLVDVPESLRLEVSHCPFLEVAESHSDVVCSVHLGLMRGILDQAGTSVAVESLEPLVEPSRCIARLHR